jgi:hypothetical protein
MPILSQPKSPGVFGHDSHSPDLFGSPSKRPRAGQAGFDMNEPFLAECKRNIDECIKADSATSDLYSATQTQELLKKTCDWLINKLVPQHPTWFINFDKITPRERLKGAEETVRTLLDPRLRVIIDYAASPLKEHATALYNMLNDLFLPHIKKRLASLPSQATNPFSLNAPQKQAPLHSATPTFGFGMSSGSK